MSITLRAWQSRFLRQLGEHRRDDFLLVACPAAGKTIAAGVAAARIMELQSADQLVVVCPTVVVRDQWQLELDRLGFRMVTQLRDPGMWPAHVHGMCTSYMQVSQRPHDFALACANRRTVVIFDEVHHAGEQLAWGSAIGEAFAPAVFRLALSGTPFRSDQARIPFLRYDADGRCLADFAYDYPRAVRDGVCRSIEFRAHDGSVSWLEDDQLRATTFGEQVDEGVRARRLRAALDPGQPYLRALLAAAHEDLLDLRRTVPDAAGLVVCDTQEHALAVDHLLAELTGEVPTLAISDVPYAHKAITAFATDGVSWLVSVRMVAEGVDIPRLAVIAWATASRTELMVRQVAGRALRGRDTYAALPAIVHIPADPHLVKYAGRLDVLSGVALKIITPDRDGEERERAARAASRRTVFQAIEAHPHDDRPITIAPRLPENPGHVHAAPETIEISTPELPESQEEIAAAEQSRKLQRADLLRLLSVYAQLRRGVEPGFTVAAAHAELVRAVGAVGPEASSERVEDALAWIHDITARLALQHPDHLVALARTKRRIALAS